MVGRWLRGRSGSYDYSTAPKAVLHLPCNVLVRDMEHEVTGVDGSKSMEVSRRFPEKHRRLDARFCAVLESLRKAKTGTVRWAAPLSEPGRVGAGGWDSAEDRLRAAH